MRSGFEVSGWHAAWHDSKKVFQSQVQRQNIISGLILHSNVLHLISNRPKTIFRNSNCSQKSSRKFSFLYKRFFLQSWTKKMKPTVKMWSELVNNEIIMTIKMPSIDHPIDRWSCWPSCTSLTMVIDGLKPVNNG